MSEDSEGPHTVLSPEEKVRMMRKILSSSRLRVARRVPNPTPFAFVPNNMDFWETELDRLIKSTSAIMYQVNNGDYQMRGEGVRLRVPYRWLMTVDNDELVQAIITGIKVSLDNRERLGY